MKLSYTFFNHRYVLMINNNYAKREDLVDLLSYDGYHDIIDTCSIYPKNLIDHPFNNPLYMCSRTEEKMLKAIDHINAQLVLKELVE